MGCGLKGLLVTKPGRLRAFGSLAAAAVVAAGVSSGCGAKSDNTPAPGSAKPAAEDSSALPAFALVQDLAGAATTDDAASSLSFNVPAPVLNEAEMEQHVRGDLQFSRAFVNEDGLGPAFNANRCVSCHARDGRGALPVIPLGQNKIVLGGNESLLLRISIEEPDATGAIVQKSVPGFSQQLYHRGVIALRPDSPSTGQADVEMSYSTSEFIYPDGERISLHKPVFKIINAYDEKPGQRSRLAESDVKVSPRIGPPVIGLGLLEIIPDEQILQLADPNDKDGDGISGRANYVRDEGKVLAGDKNPYSLGRFGWKANTATLKQQVAAALVNDMGLRSSLFPTENIAGTELFTSFLKTLAQAAVETILSPAKPDVSDEIVDALTFYSQTLGVPPRRDVKDPDVLDGARAFATARCTSCHTPSFTTRNNAAIAGFRALTIYPFSDGLVHDMGDELADGRADFLANGREWKTRPLWGVGLTQTINPRAGFLHDGRARTLEEAILFHGGEAAKSRELFAKLSRTERQRLISFLKSL